MTLLVISNAVGFSGVALALWLGFYNVTRSPARVLSRVAAVLLWACAGFFLSQLMYYDQLAEARDRYWLTMFRLSVLFVVLSPRQKTASEGSRTA